jgi:tetratricopeptide (TPR) repeat protein
VVDLLDECVRGPAMFVVEDAHFADDVTNVVLGRLAGGCRDRPWLLLTVGRTPAEYDVDEQISLEPLPDDDVAALAHSAAGDRLLTPRTLAAIVGRAGGNPLFTLELTRKAALSDDLDVLDDLPDSLEELVGAEIDRLSPRARAVLRTAAVLGTSVDRDLLITVLGDDAEVDGGSDLARFLAPAGNGGWRFRSPVVRDAAYEGLPFRRRIELHGAIADAIETRSGDRRDEQAAALSLHALVARRYRAAWGYAMVAARRAADAYANADALVFVRRGQQAMRHLTDIPALDVAQLWVLAGELHSRLAELDPATAAYREARRRAPQEAVELRAHAALCAGLAAARRGAATRALRWLAVADREAATRHELRARVAVERAHLRYTEGRLPAARRLCAQAIDLATLAGADDTLGRGLLLLDWIDIAAGQPGDEHRVRQALALFEGCGSLHRQGAVWNHLGLRSFYAGAWDAAVTDYEHARDIFTRCGDEWSASIAAANVGEILVEQGRLAAAEPLVVAALQVWRASDTPSFVGFGAAILGRLHARLGRYAQATAELSEAVESYRTSDEPLELLDAQLRVVETLLLQGSAAAASRLLDDAETRLVAALRAAGLTGAPAGPATLLPAAAPQLATVLRLRGCALALSGDGAAAEAALRASLAAATARGADHDRAQALDALAWLIDPLGAQDEAVRTELHARLGIVWTPMLPRRASELPRQRGPVTRTKRPSGRPRSA